MVEVPETRFASTSGGDRVAFQVVGTGAIDVLVCRNPTFSVDSMWDEPRLVHFLQRLSSFCRHIWFDARGTGSSDSIEQSEGRLQESVVEDMVAVLDEVGSDREALLQLGAVAISALFAATFPQRTSALVLVNATPRHRRADDYPEGMADEVVERSLEQVARADHEGIEAYMGSLADDEGFRRWFER